MKVSFFLLASFLVLVPTEWRSGWASCEHAQNFERQKNVDNHMTTACYKKDDRCPSQVTAKVRCSDEENFADGRKMKMKDELSSREMETVKDAEMKWQAAVAEKKKQQYGGGGSGSSSGVGYDSFEKEVEIDFSKEEFRLDGNGKKGQVLCAECDECELQVNPSGDGVHLRCKGCQQVPPEEVVFPGGNNKIIRLP